MGIQKSDREITAIVAAYNEAERIGSVLEVLCSYPGFAEVIVVDDGSTDGTGPVAAKHGARVIRVEPNRGKGHAMDTGVKAAGTDLLFFADADIRGLSHEAISEVTGPVVRGEAEMFVAMRKRALYYLRFIMIFIPLLGGERALTKRLWTSVPPRYKTSFQIEAALNFYAIHFGNGLKFRVFKEISQTVKERKYGFWQGLRRRFGMFRDVVQAMWDLQFEERPAGLRSRRAATLSLVAALIGGIVGLFIVLAAVVGPAQFIGAVFAEELTEDPRPYLVRFLLAAASTLGAGVLTVVGTTLLVGNGLFLFFSLVRLATVTEKRAPG
ncbi:MAG: glycosyltransferase family 2 protein [Actinomycetota bacterium]